MVLLRTTKLISPVSSSGAGPAEPTTAALPEKPTGFFNLVGPGAVLVGLAIGAGELIVWPITTARYGAGLAWAAMLGVALQLIINVEVGRYTLATGETSYAGFARLGRVWVPIFLMLNVLGWLLPAWARTCAGAVKALTVGADGPGEPWMWTALTFVFVAFVMFGPKNVYRTIERITLSLIALMLVGLVIIAVSVGTSGAAIELGRGILNIGFKPPEMPAYELFSAIVFAGAGGTTNLMFSYYLIGKGWGMAAHTNERDTNERAYIIEDNAENRHRWRAWFSHARNDQIIFFWLMNSVTILLFIFSALTVLHAQGIVPSREMLVLQEAAILSTTWGRPGATLFLLVGVACLFTTQLTLLDGVGRSCADLIHTNYMGARKYSLTTWYRVISVAWMIAGTVLTWAWGTLPPIMFLLSAGFFGGIAMAVYCPLLLITNTRLLPEMCRPSLVGRTLLAGVSIFYVVFAVTSIWVAASKLATG
jgi:hypothetical protein